MLKIKLLVACGSTICRIGLTDVFSREKDFRLVKETSNAEETVFWVSKTKPDILMLCSQSLLNGKVDFIKKIKGKVLKSKLFIFNSSFTQEQELLLIREGVMGILGSDCRPQTIVKALRKVHSGEFWIRRELIPLLATAPLHRIRGFGKSPLTKRELEILFQIATRNSNGEIASNLCISETTVKTHINNIFRKLNISDRLQATLYVVENEHFFPNAT